MVTQVEIEKFYKDVDLLAFRFPHASIVKATKESKSSVSEYLNRKKQPTEDFLKRFYAAFSESLQKVHNNAIPAGNGDYIAQLKEQIAELKQDKEDLKREKDSLYNLLNLNLHGLGVNLQITQAQLKALIKWTVEQAAGKDQQKAIQELAKINTHVGEYLPANADVGKQPGDI